LRGEGEKSASEQAGAKSEGVRVADFVALDHGPQLRGGERPAIENRFRFVMRVAIRAHPNGACEEKIPALIRETWRSKVIPERNQFPAFVQLVTGFFPQLTQSDSFDRFIFHLCRFIDLAGGNFPNGGMDREPFLSNQNELSLCRHGADHYRAFAVHDRPRPRGGPGGRANFLGRDGEVIVLKMRFA